MAFIIEVIVGPVMIEIIALTTIMVNGVTTISIIVFLLTSRETASPPMAAM